MRLSFVELIDLYAPIKMDSKFGNSCTKSFRRQRELETAVPSHLGVKESDKIIAKFP